MKHTLALLIAIALPAASQVSNEMLKKGMGENWLTYSGDYSGQRHSPLTQITKANAQNLSAKWIYHVDAGRRLQCTPIVYDGVMYITSANELHALDARSGRQIWKYRDDKVKRQAVNRGAAILGDYVYFVTSESHLVALHRKSGALLFSKQYADPAKGYHATLAPMVVKDKILVGVSGGDGGMRGFVAAMNPETGTELWRTYTIPAKGEPGSETWGDLTIEYGGGGTWLSGTYDPQLNLLYWTTGNPWPDFYGGDRKGDNLYSDSVLALDPDTGKMKWYFQFTPHDVWDWDAQAWPVLIDTIWQGKPLKALLHANRNGFFYMLDRTTGEFLRANPYVDKLTWAKGVDAKGRPVEVKGKEPTPGGNVVCPGVRGASNWMSPSYNPQTGLLYVPTLEQCDTYTSSSKTPIPRAGFAGTGGEMVASDPGKFFMRALDPKTGKRVWEYPMTGPATMWAGTVSTAGGVLFFGDDDGQLIAVDSATGKHLWHFSIGQTLTASPITFMIDGKQYVTIAGATDVVTFGLFEPAKQVPLVKEITK